MNVLCAFPLHENAVFSRLLEDTPLHLETLIVYVTVGCGRVLVDSSTRKENRASRTGLEIEFP